VPIVALEGESELARATPAAMRGVGAPEFASPSVDAYVAFAVALAKDPVRLGALRASLRDRLRTCGALDYAGLARNVEAAFRGMWRAWGEATPPT
jgi:predicted O-linked N-acetylglucosamine transferase (SPINDLY family)